MKKTYDVGAAPCPAVDAGNAGYAAGYKSVLGRQGYVDGSAAAQAEIDAKLEAQNPSRPWETERALASAREKLTSAQSRTGIRSVASTSNGTRMTENERALVIVRETIARVHAKRDATSKPTKSSATEISAGRAAAEISPSYKARLAAELQEPYHSVSRVLYEANAAEIKRLDARERELRKGRK